jgi:hypothetical protein
MFQSFLEHSRQISVYYGARWSVSNTFMKHALVPLRNQAHSCYTRNSIRHKVNRASIHDMYSVVDTVEWV